MSEPVELGRSRLTTRLLVLGSLAALILVLLTTLLVDRSIRNIWLAELDGDMETTALVARSGLPSDPAGFQAWADRTSAAGEVRLTLIDTDGVVLADSHMDPATMENHLNREEVARSMTGVVGVASRTSATTGIGERYLALPPSDGLIVRVSTSLQSIDDELASTRSAITRVSLVVAVVAVAVLVMFGRRLARPVTRLAEQAQSIASGGLDVDPERSQIVELDRLGRALEAIARDLGGRVEEAEQASATLEVVLGALPQGTVLFGADDGVIYANPAAHELLGSVPDNLGHLSPFHLQQIVRQARSESQSVVAEVDHGMPSKKLRGVATTFASDPRVLLVLVDVTDRARIDAIRRDFVANASHELKTPVATIIAAAEALQIALSRHDVSAEGFAGQIETSARQLERLVADLLDLSRLERDAPDLVPIRLGHLVVEEAERARTRVEDNELTLTVDVEDVKVMAGNRDIAIVVRNLLDNAIRYTPKGGRVQVRLHSDTDAAMLVVADTGEGIPTRDLGRVFERFYRVDSARSRDTGGTGLGLAIVKHIAETHGGSVTVESELGRGSTFTVRLPLVDDSA